MDMEELLSLLVCPRCRSKVERLPAEGTVEGLRCPKCETVYPVRDGIPVKLVEEAVSATQWEAGVRSKETR